MKKFLHHLLACLLITTLLLCGFAEASEIMPRADSQFMSTTVVLKSTKEVSFRATTYDDKATIRVSACWLQIKKDDGSWSTVCTLPPPSDVATDTFSFSTHADYIDYIIESGTYRVRATFNADGHSVTVNSNERSF